MHAWFVYIVRCADDTLYTGITTDVERRFCEHAAQGRLCAKYLRGRAPLELVFSQPADDRAAASRLEAALKKLAKTDKERLIEGGLALKDCL